MATKDEMRDEIIALGGQEPAPDATYEDVQTALSEAKQAQADDSGSSDGEDEVRDTHTDFEPKHNEFVEPGDEALERGYIGARPGKHDDSAYSLLTGPDAPTGENGPE